MPNYGEKSMFWMLVQEERTIMMRTQAVERSVMIGLQSDHWRADREEKMGTSGLGVTGASVLDSVHNEEV